MTAALEWIITVHSFSVELFGHDSGIASHSASAFSAASHSPQPSPQPSPQRYPALALAGQSRQGKPHLAPGAYDSDRATVRRPFGAERSLSGAVSARSVTEPNGRSQ